MSTVTLSAYAKVAGPSHGSATVGSSGTWTYTPAANYNGPDSFTYKANDGTADSNTATVTLTITPVNDPPVCPAASKSGNEDTLLGGSVACTDVDGDPLSYAKVAGPSHGSATVGSSGTWTYTPAANYNGPDSFTYKANDGTADSNTATVTLTITPVNDPPVIANDVGITIFQNASATPIAVLSNDNALNPDIGETLLIASVTQGAHGSVVITGGGTGLTYTPDPLYVGADSFTYKVRDSVTTVGPAIVLLDVVKAGSVTRLAGSDRYATAAAISKASFSPGVPVVYIASGLGFADALSGAPVAGIKDAPILLVSTTAIPSTIATELTRLKPATIVILGGTGAVSSSVQTALRAYTVSKTSGSVTRLAGSDRYATAAAISKASFSPGVPVVYIASGLGFADALSGAPVAGIKDAPILLVSTTAIPSTIATELTRLKPATIVILGGTGAVSSSVQTALRAYTVSKTSGSVTRLAGSDRYATAAAISKASFSPGVPVVYIASGLGFADALSGAPVAGIKDAPILLVSTTAIPSTIATELTRLKPATIVILGGTGAVSSSVQTALGKYTAGP